MQALLSYAYGVGINLCGNKWSTAFFGVWLHLGLHTFLQYRKKDGNEKDNGTYSGTGNLPVIMTVISAALIIVFLIKLTLSGNKLAFFMLFVHISYS